MDFSLFLEENSTVPPTGAHSGFAFDPLPLEPTAASNIWEGARITSLGNEDKKKTANISRFSARPRLRCFSREKNKNGKKNLAGASLNLPSITKASLTKSQPTGNPSCSERQ